MDTQPQMSYWLFVILGRENQFEGYRAIIYLCAVPGRVSVDTPNRDHPRVKSSTYSSCSKSPPLCPTIKYQWSR